MWKIQLFELNYDEQEKKAVADVLESGWITMGERTQVFERSFGEFLGHGAMATAVSNGTAFLCHRGCGIQVMPLKGGSGLIVRKSWVRRSRWGFSMLVAEAVLG
jgi:hypothetical protein